MNERSHAFRRTAQLLPLADFRWVFEATPVPCLILSRELSIVAVNEAYLKATMTTREAILGQDMFDVFPDNPGVDAATGVKNLRASIRRVLQSRMPDTMAIQRYDIADPHGPAGTFQVRYWSPVNSPVLDEHGEVAYVIHRVEDVTDFIQLREQLPAGGDQEALRTRMLAVETELLVRARDRQEMTLRLQETNQALEALNRAKNAFLSNVSHELRTPLSLVLGPLEDLLHDPSPALDDRRADIDMVYRNLLRLRKTVNMLLEYSRAEVGVSAALFEPTNLSALTSELASLFRAAVEHAGLRFIVDCRPLPDLIYVDRSMWESIVFNLLSNAFKFTLEGEIEISLRPAGSNVELVVRDTGSGIPEQEQPQLFQRFFRGQRSRARTAEGTGIGLALVQEMAHAHGGTVHVQSTVNEGSSFTITLLRGCEHLPAERIFRGVRLNPPSNAAAYLSEVLSWTAANTLSASPPTPSRDRLRRILLVEDNADVRGYLTRLLGASYQVEGVADGDAAIEAIGRSPPDLLVTDLMMVGLTGIDLVRLLRADTRTAGLPIMILSASSTEDARIAAIEAGANDFLAKPFSSRELFAHVAGLLVHGELVQREQRLREEVQRARMRLELVLESIRDGFAITDWQGRLLFLNSRQATLLGKSRDQLLEQNFLALAAAPVVEAWRAVAATAQPAYLEFEDPAAAGWWAVRIYAAGEGMAILTTDISERRAAELKVQEAQAKLQVAADIVRLGYWELDFAGDEIHCSPRFQLQDNAPAERGLALASFLNLIHPDDQGHMNEILSQLGGSGELDAEVDFRMRTEADGYRWFRSRMRVLVDAQGRRRRLLGTHLDITERKLLDERTLQVAQLDTLTGLPNRKLFTANAERIVAIARRHGRGVAVLFMDLDGFKPVNDSYGHEMGDKLLKAVAERIGTAIRREDLLGRIGGDEFVAVLSDVDSDEDVELVAQHVVRSVSRQYVIDEATLNISTSMGISRFPADADTVETLIQYADWAMYEAKKGGRGRYAIFKADTTMGRDEAAGAALAGRLRGALAAEEFYVVYQPVFDTTSGALVAAEALLRWRQADGRYLGPLSFVPVADGIGMGKPLGDWLLQTVWRDRQSWKAQGLAELAISVNVSSAQLRQPGFVDAVADAVGEADRSQVVVELAEQTVMNDQAPDVLQRLKALGVGIAIDSFGTGYSNLGRLASLPVNRLKVDKSFVGGSNGDGLAVAAIVALGQALDKEIVAEGIETAAAFDLARRRGCRYAQGFHLGRPMPATDFAQWLRQRAA